MYHLFLYYIFLKSPLLKLCSTASFYFKKLLARVAVIFYFRKLIVCIINKSCLQLVSLWKIVIQEVKLYFSCFIIDSVLEAFEACFDVVKRFILLLALSMRNTRSSFLFVRYQVLPLNNSRSIIF